jgi:hypothetical protein
LQREKISNEQGVAWLTKQIISSRDLYTINGSNDPRVGSKVISQELYLDAVKPDVGTLDKRAGLKLFILSDGRNTIETSNN